MKERRWTEKKTGGQIDSKTGGQIDSKTILCVNGSSKHGQTDTDQQIDRQIDR